MKENLYPHNKQRRTFLRNGGLLVAGATMIGVSGTMVSCKGENEYEPGVLKNSTANEELMEEHGLLQRALLIYDAAIVSLRAGESFDPLHIHDTAKVIQTFIEEYHEDIEEKFVFPPVKANGQHSMLIDLLIKQHVAGKRHTQRIISQTEGGKLPKGDELQKFADGLAAYNTMYRHHEAREDTEVFPALKRILPPSEYRDLADKFDELEQEKFGAQGFEAMLDKIEAIERKAGVADIGQFITSIQQE